MTLKCKSQRAEQPIGRVEIHHQSRFDSDRLWDSLGLCVNPEVDHSFLDCAGDTSEIFVNSLPLRGIETHLLGLLRHRRGATVGVHEHRRVKSPR